MGGRALVKTALHALGAGYRFTGEPDLRKRADVRAILETEGGERRECILALARAGASHISTREAFVARQILAMTARRRLALEAGDVRELLELARATGAKRDRGPWIASQLLAAVAKRIEEAAEGWSEEEAADLAPLLEAAAEVVDDEALAGRLRVLLRGGGGLPLELISAEDDVGPRWEAVLTASGEDPAVLADLLEHLLALPASGKPSKRWLAGAEALRERLADAPALAGALLGAMLDASDVEKTFHYESHDYTGTYFFAYRSGNEQLALAIVRLAALTGDPALLEPLRRLAVKAVTVIGGQFGQPRSLKLANAAALSIADMAAPGSITELLALERAIRHGTLLKEIRKAVEALAEAQGMTREELLERAVEHHDLDADGRREVPLSEGAARVELDARGAALVFAGADGRARKSFPAAVKDADGDTLAALRAELKQIRKTIAGERHRLDEALALDRSWALADWRALYLDHPVTGRLARELIWRFGDGLAAIPTDGGSATTAAGEAVPIPSGEVRLWHPIEAGAEEVRAWRQRLLDEERVQPVKQAFRETYSLTPAEEQTRVYSNRFAAHVFRQTQARALMKGRGWKPVALAWWDDGVDHGVARRTFEPAGVRAEFFYDPIVDMDPTGDLWPYCTSDQVRFFGAGGDEPLALADVPPIVFTEAMRDVDLFIGVTSIGADPEWLDRGEGRRFTTYWHDFSFGELGAAAKVRREVVAQLVPRLSIADRCELDERHLVVRGDLHSYRIHLGSGNVLMSPNDRYLCIVATRDGRASKLFLPFDDDPVLSLILSKAFLLADDTTIDDETILAQMNA